MGWALGIVAALTWTGTLYQVRALVRPGRSPMVLYYWLTLLAISLALTFAVPEVYTAIGRASGVPNLGKLLTNLGAVAAALGAQCAVYFSLVPEPSGSRLRRSALVGSVTAMLAMVALFMSFRSLGETWRFWEYYNQQRVASYRLVYLAYMAVSAGAITFLLVRYAFRTGGASLKTAFVLMASGGLIGLAYLVNDAVAVLNALGWHPVEWLGHSGATGYLIATTVALFLAGATMPVWTHAILNVRAHVAYVRLRGLWLKLRRLAPASTLLPERPLWADVLDLRDATFRLHRQVIEIRDASYAAAAGAGVWPETAYVAATPRVAGLEDAASLHNTDGYDEDDGYEGAAGRVGHAADGGDFWKEVAELVRVAKGIKGPSDMDGVLRTLVAVAGPAEAPPMTSHGERIGSNRG